MNIIIIVVLILLVVKSLVFANATQAISNTTPIVLVSNGVLESPEPSIWISVVFLFSTDKILILESSSILIILKIKINKIK